MKMNMPVQVAMLHVSKHNLYQPFAYKGIQIAEVMLLRLIN